MIDGDNAYKVLMAINVIITLLLSIYTWISNRERVSRDAIDQVSDTVDDIDKRVTRLEEGMRHIPSKQELAEVHGRITQVSEAQNSMRGELSHMSKTLDLIHECLLTRGDK